MGQYNRGRFGGELDASRDTTLLKVLRWKLSSLFDIFKTKPFTPLETVDDSAKLSAGEDFVCWLGHAGFLLQLGGKRILLDPVFGDIPFYKRKSPAPYAVEALPPVDYVLISHTHYDHFDAPSLKALKAAKPLVIVPLNAAPLVAKAAASLECRELDWYESYETDGLKITLVPAKHMSRRTPFDNNKVLWGGFVLEHGGTCIYFAGDTGPGPHFKEIGRRFNIDYALLPIGAYAPGFVMKYTHVSPREAYDAFRQLNAKHMVPMHYGTFDLSDEPLDEPLEWMRKIAEKHPGDVLFMQCGEVKKLPKERAEH